MHGCRESITPTFDGVPSLRGACFRKMVLLSVCCIGYDSEAQTPSSPASRDSVPLPFIQSNQNCAADIELGGCGGSINRREVDERSRCRPADLHVSKPPSARTEGYSQRTEAGRKAHEHWVIHNNLLRNCSVTTYFTVVHLGGQYCSNRTTSTNSGKVYTSYDYRASIVEARQLTTRYDALKGRGLFVRSPPEFYKTDWIADSSTGLSILSSGAVFATYLLNPDTQAGFYIVRHNDSTSTDITDFQIPIIASAVTLNGRQSKVIVTNYAFGSSGLLYSTTSIFFSGIIDGRDVLFIYGDTSQEHEIALSLTGRSFRKDYDTSSFRATLTPSSVITIFSFPTGTQGLVMVYDSDSQLVLFADSDTITTFWAPVIPGDTSDSLRNFWGLGTNQSVLVGGPYLVRSASITGTELALKGDLKASTPLTIIAPAVVSSVTWNGAALSVDASSSLTVIGGLV
ncbi:uncharacterized protein ARMOST_21793 [Armillaria ostoyae]|uniref:Beta-galactosidase domain-containing protein n=1 Tax=Armillaria ostoyae TaxID=47428 RepID=A0A284SB50_ARMOS|nr:uncharacterized protein ARMOST_21793 [Armillaria ostoyae]